MYAKQCDDTNQKHHREENSIGVRDDGNIPICQRIRAANVYIHLGGKVRF